MQTKPVCETPRGFFTIADGTHEEAATKLFQLCINHPLQLKKFETRKEIVELAYRTFGTEHFLDWISYQATGGIRRDFIIDTVEYILSGERKFDISTWDSLISNDEVDSKNARTWSQAEIDLFNIPTPGHPRNLNKGRMPNIIQKWVEHPNGHMDLLYTLYILFGTDLQH